MNKAMAFALIICCFCLMALGINNLIKPTYHHEACK